jgi:hypothetical protein
MDTATKTALGYTLGAEVLALTGVFAGQCGLIDEIDPTDEFKPYRVRFEDIDGEPIAWYAATGIKPTGSVR